MRGRRRFLRFALAALAAPLLPPARGDAMQQPRTTTPRSLRLFLCGDVMLGRGVDQILPHPSPPVLHESYVRDARRYVALAEQVHGEIPRPVAFAYVWGDALAELARRRPDLRLINLETAITRSDRPWPKGIHYRLHPRNAPCLAAADIDCCVLANNHLLDWERAGLTETLATLQRLRIRHAGAGADLDAARAPAALPLGDGTRLLVFAAATDDCGVPAAWAATASRAGVHRLPDLSARTLAQLVALVRRHRHAGDRVLVSLHWGGNWGFAVPPAQRAFAHGLIEEAGADLVHGHSSHHVKAAEVHRGRLILYGCGDFLNDYEGIEGYDQYRGELGLMYFPTLAGDGRLLALELVPTRIRRFRIERARGADRDWLLATLRREYGRYDCGVESRDDGGFALQWRGADRAPHR
jgi:poly-gamma-glutamate synthesis protein (capsule biosynthesis protein)